MHTLALTLAAHLSLIASVFSFFNNILSNVETAFRHYGYLIVFLPILGESAGIPMPGETVLLAGGLAASKGILFLPFVILVGAAAAILGDNLGYLVGRRGGRPLLFRYGRLLRVKDRQIAVLDSFFERHGPKTVFFGRWVIFLRVWAALFAGASRMEWRQFFVYNALGGLAWATTMGSLAYLFAASVVRISKVFGVLAWVFAICVAIAVAVFIDRLQRRAENRAQVEAAEQRIHAERAEYEARRTARRVARQRR
jgi:membrane protein DedA with SNARE-associated domain